MKEELATIAERGTTLFRIASNARAISAVRPKKFAIRKRLLVIVNRMSRVRLAIFARTGPFTSVPKIQTDVRNVFVLGKLPGAPVRIYTDL